jgi:hypothetical protein
MAVMAALGAYGMSLADASAKTGDAANDASVMADVISQLSPADQVTFLGNVNAAISKMGASTEEKTAKFLAANEAAIKAASKESKAALIAETFATVPPESLTVINERFAEDLLSRKANADKKVSDADFFVIATNLMAIVEQRNAGNDNAGVRDTFAALMLLRASGDSSSQELRDALLGGIPDAESRELAQNDWVPGALGDNGSPSYDSMLGSADAGAAPDEGRTLELADPTPMGGSIYADLAGGTSGNNGSDAFGGAVDQGVTTGDILPPLNGEPAGVVPRTLNEDAPWYSGYRRGGGNKGSDNAGEGGEDQPYGGQSTY